MTYKDDCTSTDITETPALVSWCYPGQFRVLARIVWGDFRSLMREPGFNVRPTIQTNISSDARQQQEFAAAPALSTGISSSYKVINQFVSAPSIISDIADITLNKIIEFNSSIAIGFDFVSTTYMDRTISSAAAISFALNVGDIDVINLFSSNPTITSNIDSDASQFNSFTSTAAIAWTVSDANIDVINKFVSYPVINFDIQDPGIESFRSFSSGADIDFTVECDGPNLERNYSFAADIDFNFISDLDQQPENWFASQADIVADISSDINAVNEFASQADIVTATSSDLLIGIGFDSKIKIIIPATSVDEDLINFPVRINIDEISGVNAEDLSQIFTDLRMDYDSLTPVAWNTGYQVDFTSDDFTGDDGDEPNPYLWGYSDGDATISIENNTLQIELAAGDIGNNHIQQHGKLVGDFDIQADLPDLLGQKTITQGGIYLSNTLLGHVKWAAMMMNFSGGQQRWSFRYDDDGSNSSQDYVNTSYAFGKLRLVRVGSTLSAYYDDLQGGGWTQIGTGESWTSEDVYFGFYFYRGVTTGPTYHRYDNFLINSGTVVGPEFIDIFTGTNGTPPNTYLWNSIIGTPTIQDNKLRLSTETTNEEVESIFRISGDFSIQVGLNLVTYPATDNWNFTLRLWNEAEDDGVTLERRYDAPTGHMIKFFDYDTGWVERDSDTTSITAFKFKFVRVGSIITASYWNGSSWIVSGTSSVLGTQDIKVRFKSAKWSGNPTAVADYDNFVINSGTVVWPDSVYRTNQYKIAVTEEDETTHQYVEIENVGNGLVLNTKVALLSSTIDTVMWLHWDSTLKAVDNTGFVGIPTSLAAQTAWNDDFVLVSHLNDLTVDESTSYDVQGIPVNLDVSDIVNGLKNGLAIEYDGTTERINWGSGAHVDDIPLLTVETLFKAGSLGALGALIDKATSVGWSFLLDNVSNSLFFQRDSSGGLGKWNDGTNTISLDVWHYGAVTHDNTDINNDPNFQLDEVPGTPAETGTPSGAWDSDAAATLNIGNSGAEDRGFDGLLGEIRVSKVIRSNAWLAVTQKSLIDQLNIYSGNKQLKVVVDSSLIDAELTNFPLSIILDTTTAPELLTELAWTAAGDDFTGTDADPPDAHLWLPPYTVGANIASSIGELFSNSYKSSVTANGVDNVGRYKHMESIFKFPGDFDVQVDVSFSWTGVAVKQMCYMDHAGGVCFIGFREIDEIRSYINGSSQIPTTRNFNYGKLRIIRSGTTVTHQIQDGAGGWEQIQSTNGGAVTTTPIRLVTYVYDSNTSATCFFDNFVINSGTVLWANNTHPNRKKIFITDVDENRLNTELDWTDIENSLMVIHTKIPTISATVDTVLYVHFDILEDDSDDVGDAGSVIGQSVWDDDFMLVMHMSQIPLLDADCILDSTSNFNHGTPESGPVAADLISDEYGAKLNFYNANWVIRIPHSATIDLEDEKWAIETFTQKTNNLGYEIFMGKNYGGVGVKWWMLGLKDTGEIKGWIDDGTNVSTPETIVQYDDGFHYTAFIRDNVANEMRLLIDGGAEEVIVTDISGDITNTGDLIIGGRGDKDTAYFYGGSVLEVRISKDRSDAWLKATYYGLMQNSTLLSFEYMGIG